MREKYETLSLAVLRELAKARGLRGISGLKKSDLIDRMVTEDEKLKEQNSHTEAALETAKTQTEQPHIGAQPEKQEQAQSRTENRTDRQERPEGRMDRQERSEGRIDRQERPEGRIDRQERPDTRMEGRTDRQERPEARADRQEAQNAGREMRQRRQENENNKEDINSELDSGVTADGILEVMPDGYGFIRCENYLPGEHDVYVSPSQIRRFGLKTGDIVRGNTRIKTQGEKFSALLYITTINGYHPSVVAQRRNFEDLTPIFPNARLRLETNRTTTSMRIVDLVSPIGKGQRGMIVSPPKAGKTTLLKQIAQAVKVNNPEIHLIILLIDERPEEVTDIKEAIEGENVEVIYSTFDELPEHHKRVSEMVIERAKRLVEHKQDVLILLDSITRLARAYNLTVPPSGRTLSGGLDPAALHMPKRFFGAARNMREGGSLTVLASALVDTGSKMDDVIYEEFKGTGNMELVLDRKLSEKRVFPAIDIVKSGTRREDLLLDREEREAVDIMRKGINGMKTDEAVENILNMFSHTGNNRDFIQLVKKRRV
ncbi:MAG: transcription termination factor Rho [Eubacterium sp.]|nr:transcription termination factor Rho [Eubacterium sp.]